MFDTSDITLQDKIVLICLSFGQQLSWFSSKQPGNKISHGTGYFQIMYYISNMLDLTRIWPQSEVDEAILQQSKFYLYFYRKWKMWKAKLHKHRKIVGFKNDKRLNKQTFLKEKLPLLCWYVLNSNWKITAKPQQQSLYLYIVRLDWNLRSRFSLLLNQTTEFPVFPQQG